VGDDDEQQSRTESSVVDASVVGLGIVLRSLAPALEQVTLQQYRILVLLATRGPLRAGDLAVELGLLPSGITRMVDRLVRDGWVTRRTSGREVLVTAGEDALALVEHVLARRAVEFRAALRRMTPEERSAVRTAADALARTAIADPVLDAQLRLATPPGR
jgi:DNA-binding MarR family transcriptional regulator